MGAFKMGRRYGNIPGHIKNSPKRDEVLIRGLLRGGGGMATYRATLNNI